MVILGLGSNLGDRAQHLRQAVQALAPLLSGLRCSPVYESRAMLPEGAPQGWDVPFLNMAVCGQTALPPRRLLQEAKAVEQALGRVDRGRWGPREMDIDILAYDDLVIDEPDLKIPHSGLLQRDFALIPLADLAPGWAYPVPGPFYGRQARALAEALDRRLIRADSAAL